MFCKINDLKPEQDNVGCWKWPQQSDNIPVNNHIKEKKNMRCEGDDKDTCIYQPTTESKHKNIVYCRHCLFCSISKPMTCLLLQTLDKVVMEMSTCDEPRPPNGPSPIATASGQR